MKQKEIAKKYNTTINTVKSWSRRYEWSKKKKKGAHQNKSVHTKKECKKIAEEIVETSELDEEHQLFCIYYLKYHNKVKAYQKVKPNTPYNSACVMASRWSKQSAVIEEINRLKKELQEDALLDPHDIVQKYIDIAFADLNDYLEYGQEEVPVIIKNPITGEDEVLKQTVNMVKFKESAFADGTILSEVKQGRNGASIKLADRMKALDWLSKHMNLATEEQRAKIDLIKAQTRKITIDDEQEEIIDDGFLEALNASAKEDWEDEEDQNSIQIQTFQQKTA